MKNSSHSAAGAFALMAYGMVANPDHVEKNIPDHELFDLTYKNAMKLNPYLNFTRPLRWAGVLFSEAARNVYLPQNETEAWMNVLFPTVSAWEALIRMGASAGIITDWQLSQNSASSKSKCKCGKHNHEHITKLSREGTGSNLFSQGYRVIIVPIAHITAEQNSSLTGFEQAGGKVIYLNPKQPWSDVAERRKLENTLQQEILSKAGPVPVRLQTSNQFAHSISLQSSNRPSSFVVMVTNDYRWIYFPTGIPTVVTGATVVLSNSSADIIRSATDILNNVSLETQWHGNRTWTIHLPNFSQYLAVEVQCNGLCWS